MSAEVAVDAPPGLQHMGCGFGGPPLSPFQATPGTSNGSNSPPLSPGDMKDELIREVTDAVREHIEWKTSAAVDTLWQRGQRALQHMQQQQLNQTATLRAQLEAHAEMQKKLERDNAMLRQALEALVGRLSGVLSNPHTQPPRQFQSPHAARQLQSPPPSGTVDSSQASIFAAAAAQAMSNSTATEAVHPSPDAPAVMSTPVAEVATPCKEKTKTAPSEKKVSFDDTPEISELSQADAVFTPPRTAAVPQGIIASSVAASAGLVPNLPSAIGTGTPPSFPNFPSVIGSGMNLEPQSPTFQLILRRADNVPLGLDVRGDPEEKTLVVESVRSGGAVEAWNRQCADNCRVVKAGDQIVKINDAEDSEAMRSECVNKQLLRITVHRGHSFVSQLGNLRADADEFVPGHPAPTSSC